MTIRSERLVVGLPRRVAVAYLLLLVVALVAYYFLWRNTPGGDGDTPQYLEVAKDLADLRLDAFHDRTIGYPLLLALTGAVEHSTHLLLVASLLLHLASVWLLAVVLNTCGVSRRWLVVFAVTLLLPLYVEPAAWVLTENLAQFTLVLGFACLVLGMRTSRISLIALSGLAFGYAALTRPVYQALGPALAVVVVVLVRRAGRSMLQAAASVLLPLVAGWVVVVGSMSLVNYSEFDYFGLTPSFGLHLCTRTMAFVERLPEEYAQVREIFIKERDAQLVKRGSVHTGSQTIWSVRPQLTAATGLAGPALSSYLLRMNLALIRKAPIEYLQEVARSMAVYWFPPATPLASMHSSVLRWLWAFVYVGITTCFFVQLVMMAGVGVFEASRRWFRAAIPAATPWRAASVTDVWAYMLAGCIVAYTMLMTCFIDIGDPRQRRPTDVLVVFLCMLGAHVWRRSLANAAGNAAPSSSISSAAAAR